MDNENENKSKNKNENKNENENENENENKNENENENKKTSQELYEEEIEKHAIIFLNTILEYTEHDTRIKELYPNLLIRDNKEYKTDFVGLSTKDEILIIKFNKGGLKINEIEELEILGNSLKNRYNKPIQVILIAI